MAAERTADRPQAGVEQPRFANARSVRNALEQARLLQANRLVSGPQRRLGRDDVMRIEADDLLKSRVFED